jgi:hypothetical protein
VTFHFCSLITNDSSIKRGIKSRIVMAKAVKTMERLFTSKFYLDLRKKLVNCYN